MKLILAVTFFFTVKQDDLLNILYMAYYVLHLFKEKLHAFAIFLHWTSLHILNRAIHPKTERPYTVPGFNTLPSILQHLLPNINLSIMNQLSLLIKNTGVGNAMHDPTTITKISFMKKIVQKPGRLIIAFLMMNLFFTTASFGQITLVTGSQTNQQTSGTTLSVNKPTNLAVGDLMVSVLIQVDNGENDNLSNATGSGWTLIAGEEIGNVGSDSWWGTVLYKVATAADVAATSFSFTLDADVESSQGGIAAFRGVAVTGGVSGGPLDVAVLTSAINSINTDDYSATGITTATANAAVVMLGMVADDRTASGWAATSPASLSQIFSVTQAPSGPDMGIGMAWALKTSAGGTGTGIAELSSNENDPNGALLIALRPCTANPTITTASTPQPAAAVCFSGSSQTTTLAYTGTTNSPTAYSIDWNAAANTAGLTDQNSTAFAFAGGGGSVTGINIPASVAAGTYSGTMYVTTAGGCITSKTITLTINPAPTVNAGPALSAICQGGISAALGGSVGGAATGGTWTDGGVGGAFNPDATTLNATWTPPGAYTGTAVLTLTTTGGSCGTTFASKNQIVNGTPTTAAAGGDDAFCIGAYTLGANTALVGAGAWTIPSGPNTSTAQITGGLSNPTATFTPTAAGVYTLRWTISNSGCTSSFDEVSYTVNALPQVTAFSGNSICSGGIGTLTATITGATDFTVTYNPGGVSEPGVQSGIPFNVTPNPGSPGTTNYTIISVQDNNGCIRNSGFTDAAASITVNPSGTWAGTTTDWFTPSNWCGGAIPTASTDVVIPSGGIQPTINAAGAVCNNITIAGTLTFSGTGDLTVSGNFTNNGTVTAGAGTTIEFDGTTQTVSGSSTTTFRNLTVNSSTSLSLNANAAVAGTLSVPASRLLIVNATTLTINAGATGSISGTLRSNGTVTTNSNLTFNNGGSYEHNFTTTSGVIPASTWSAGSTCRIIGYTTFSGNPSGGTGGVGGYNQSFSNFIWNAPNQTAAGDISLGGALTTVTGDFTLTNTGAGSLALGNSGAGNLSIGGNFTQTGGAFIISQSAARTVTVAGNASISGGSLDLSASITAGNSVSFNVGGDFSHTAGTITESGSVTTTAIVFTKAGTQLYTSGGTVSNSVDYTVNSSSTLQLGTGASPAIVTGGGVFTNNGTLAITSPQGITTSACGTGSTCGNIRTTTRTFNTGTSYEYIGASAQATGNGLPATINNLTIDNAADVTLTSNTTVNGILDFANGLLTTGANTVTIASTGSITNASSSKYVNGKLAKAFTTTTPFTYPIGKGGVYRPVVFNYATTTSKTVTIEQFEAAFPVAVPASVSVANFGSRYWNVTQSATGTNFFLQLDGSGVTPAGTVRMIRSENGGAASSNAVTSPDYTNSAAFATSNTSSNFSLGETAIPLTINGVTVTATKVYDGNTIAALNTGSATLSGVISPDVVTLNSGSAVGNYADKHIGTGKAITVTGFTLGGANGGAYSLPTPNQVAGLTADITVRPITVSAVTDTKTYDGTASSAAAPSYSLQPGDATGTAPTQSFDTKHVGTGKTLTASGLVINDGNSGNNYSISYADDNTGEIQVRNITVTAATDTKDYDGNNSSAGAPTYTLQPGDATGTAPTQTYDNANAGTNKVMTASGLVINDGNGGNNYNINYATNNTGVINQLAVTVTPDAGQFKVFGDADPVFTYTASPSLISPDVFSGSLSRNAGEAIGFYAYTLGSLSASGNYSVSLGGSNTFEIQAISQSNADFRSKQNGDFSTAATWEYDLGGGNWQNATQAPTSANSVSITHDVVLNQNHTVGASKTFTLGTGAIFTINPTRTLTIAGSADFAGKPVTIQSDNTGTGSIGQITGSLTNATDVTVERYIPNNGFRSWRLLSVPTFGSGQTIRQAWQEGDANPLPMQNNLANRGTQITGVFTTQAAAAAAGFDSTSVTAGMLTWNGSSWSNVTTTNSPIANNQAYFLYIRGERSKGVTGTATNASATTLRTNGTIYTGDQATNIGANSFALVPNLYPSSIDFTGLTRTGGVSNLFYVWDSKKQNGSSLGVYQTFSGINSFNCMISGGSYVLNQPNKTVESGQAFFVQTSGTPGTITLKETAKISNTNGSLGFRPSTPADQLVKIDTRLYGPGANNMIDANAVVFDAAYSNDVDADDAPKLTNPGENIGIQKTNIVLAVEGRQPVSHNDVVQYKIWNLQQQTYRLELAASNMGAQGVSAVLEDAYLNSSTPLDLNGTTSVSFTVNGNAASAAANRFRVVFRQLAPVPVNFVSIEANRTNNGVNVAWKSASERGIKNYTIERSTDGGRTFTATGNKAAASNNAIEINYNFMDATAPSVALLYRIKSQGVNNEIRYSPIAKVSAGNMQPGFAVSPNPVENGVMNVVFKNQESGKYSIRVTSSNGETVKLATVSHAGGNSNQPVILPAGIARGAYNVEIVSPNNTKTVQAIMVNNK